MSAASRASAGVVAATVDRLIPGEEGEHRLEWGLGKRGKPEVSPRQVHSRRQSVRHRDAEQTRVLRGGDPVRGVLERDGFFRPDTERGHRRERSEEHTSELQSQSNLVCRLLLEKKK